MEKIVHVAGDGTPEMGNDPTTGLCGVKFDEGIEEIILVSFISVFLDIIILVKLTFGIKAAQNTPTIQILGPTDCTDNSECPPSCEFLMTRTWTAEEHCGNDVIATQEIFIDNSAGLTLHCPEDLVIDGAFTQAQIEVALNEWRSQFGFEGGCLAYGQFAESDTLDLCNGGLLTVEYTVTSICEQ